MEKQSEPGPHGYCPFMSTTAVVIGQRPTSLGSSAGQIQVEAQPVQLPLMIQCTKDCQFFDEMIDGCVIRYISNLRELVNQVMPPHFQKTEKDIKN